MRTFRLTVHGEAEPAGSKKAFMKPGMRYPVVVDANANAKGWKRQVAAAAAELHLDELLEGALAIEIHFFGIRPKGHYGTGRNAGVLRDAAPLFPTVRPDIDKLTRGVLDGLTGALYRDDAQIVRKYAEKHYGTPPRVEILVTVIEQQTVGTMVADDQLALAAA